MTRMVLLRAGDLEALVLPEIGGSLAYFRRDDGVDLMRAAKMPAVKAGDVLGTACFPLVPFSGRIAGGRLSFQGRTYALPLNAGEGNALHGDGWQCPWAVAHEDETEVVLALADPKRGWPWAYSARQTYRLDGTALTIALALTNESDGPMPAGLGIHPWFDATPDVALRFAAERVYQVDDGYLFSEVTPVPAAWDFGAGRPVAGTDLVNGFSGWRGGAEITWPGRGARLTIEADPPLGHLVVYTPAGQGFFCVEPVTHSVDAFNLHARGMAPDNGTVVLPPGGTLQVEARFAAG